MLRVRHRVSDRSVKAPAAPGLVSSLKESRSEYRNHRNLAGGLRESHFLADTNPILVLERSSIMQYVWYAAVRPLQDRDCDCLFNGGEVVIPQCMAGCSNAKTS